MENTKEWKAWFAEREARLNEKFGAFRSAPKEHKISAMPVVIGYTAIIGRVEYYKRGGEPVFKFTRTVEKGSQNERWQEVQENVYAIRDEFLKVKTPEKAAAFLLKTGIFSPLSDTITWSEFEKWQRFAHLIQEHKMLAEAMNNGTLTGECAEVLKALSDFYPSSFFEGSEILQTPEAREYDEWILRQKPELQWGIQEGMKLQESKRRKMWGWFRQPPFSIEWMPNSQEAEQSVKQKFKAGGAMIEFLLPQEELQPVLVIRPKTTLQAIAAAIYAERIQGVKYRTCDWCGDLFKIGARSTKAYCDAPRPCKGNAHKKRTRNAAKARKEAGLKAPKPDRKKAKKARRA